MIVECPRCSARYRVEEELLKEEPTFKCSRCSHIFPYKGGEEPPAEPPETTSHSPSREPEPRSRRTEGSGNESLSFTFGERSGTSSDPSEHDMPDDEPTTTNGARPEEEEDFVFSDEEDERLGLDEDDEPVETAPADEPRFVRGEDELRIEQESASHPERPYLIFLVLLALLYANLALYLRNHPAEASQLLASIPLAGRLLTEDRLLQARIHLDEIEGVYQKIKDDRLVFIVSGRAVNTSQQPLKGIQIESTLYGDADHPLDSKSIYCGNAMSLKIVKDLSSKEISLLQRLEPPQRFEIQPGESAGFTVVFMSPPDGLKHFSARVVAAERTVS